MFEIAVGYEHGMRKMHRIFKEKNKDCHIGAREGKKKLAAPWHTAKN